MRYYAIIAIGIAGIVIGCTSVPLKSTSAPAPTIESTSTPNTSDISQLNDTLCYLAGLCHSLYAEGTITLKDGSSSQSGHFELRSKRDAMGHDSLSMVVTGPFGISAAKFLGTPTEFHFYNAIENEKYNGVPDEKTLEKLTGIKGFSFRLLHDLVYGLSPLRFRTEELTMVKKEQLSTDRYRLVANSSSGAIEAVNFRNSKNVFKVTGYDRWSSITSQTNDLSVSFSGIFEHSPFAIPSTITATSGSQSLELEYSKVEENPKNLTVKVKIPQ